ncbi:hypothetical protein [Siphonobacter sp. SORGH_AS_0500]|uniref:hypothetical protein n=1 Tax=Siphonobacter sp. SORGH_AS_0500 TaxID=1864824 RepID=UPI00285890B6|nr:hypothetical protein [Siphonobacter sp. SORGH_AS_0500]MDR6197536.1 hypothetical protein [Siphonobacter sp. SORGH_AS_0500]
MIKTWIALSLTWAGITYFQETPFPKAEISNGLIKASLYLPDAEKGYYRAQRFDWSGVIGKLEYKGHSFFGPWRETHDPLSNDGISGPVEEFMPIGYAEAQPGETFLKIGVGTLKKTSNQPYHFWEPFEHVNKGIWKSEIKKDRAIYTHTFTDASGYAYVYEKTLRLLPDQPILVLEHRLKNTGTRTLLTQAYDHNFFVFDQHETGPSYRVTFPFELTTDGPTEGLGNIAAIKGNQWTYKQPVPPKVSTQAFLKGFGNSAKDYNIRVENDQIGVQIKGDQPITKIVYWSQKNTLCPEPYIQIKAEPGQEFSWKIEYEFFVK